MRQQPDKPIVWLKGEVKTPPFSRAARLEAGMLLRRLQRGEVLGLPHSRPMPSIGTHCHEMRIPDRDQSWRIVYHVADDAIAILEVFSKKTQSTPSQVVELSQSAQAAKARRQQPRSTPSAGRHSESVVREFMSCKTLGRICQSYSEEGTLMNNETKKRLECSGWAVGGAADFLELSPEETTFIELKLTLAAGIRELREKSGLTQAQVATRLRSSQSRVAKMEAGDRSVSLDLLVRSLLRIGASPTEIAKWIRRAEVTRAA